MISQKGNFGHVPPEIISQLYHVIRHEIGYRTLNAIYNYLKNMFTNQS